MRERGEHDTCPDHLFFSEKVFEAVNALNEMKGCGDNETVHTNADQILLNVLETLGGEVVKAYEELKQEVTLWYA